MSSGGLSLVPIFPLFLHDLELEVVFEDLVIDVGHGLLLSGLGRTSGRTALISALEPVYSDGSTTAFVATSAGTGSF